MTSPNNKKEYQTPTLRRFGSVQEITQTNSGSNGSDGGSFPNGYAS